MGYHCSGYVTRNDLLCSDGRTIRRDAFKNQDGERVSLIWNHNHTDPEAVLGHADLENREDGVYGYLEFNNTPAGQHAKELVEHGDVRCLSIWANHLKQVGSDVVHGIIREVSLVLAGANEGAYVDFVLAHGDDETDGLYACYDESGLVIYHSADMKEEKGETEVAKEVETKATAENAGEETVEDVFNTLSEKQKKVVYALIGQAVEDAKKGAAVKHSDEEAAKEDDDDDETVEDVFNTLTEKQQKVVYALIGQAIEDSKKDTVKHSDEDNDEYYGGNETMKHNVFENETKANEVLSHSEFAEIMESAKRGNGRLSEAFLSHGITDIEYLFPDYQTLKNTPDFHKRDTRWVDEFLKEVHKTPFSRIKSVYADITEADARAKGYLKKGEKKIDELFTLLKRETPPTTVYKKQSIDRDDYVDITDMDVIAWLKAEMRMMLDEEIARAALVGDGRNPSSNDKINEQNIRPIWTDEDRFTIKVNIPVTAETSDDDKAKAFIKACIKSRKEYKGSGTPNMYMSEDMLTSCLLLEDLNGRVIYDTVEKLATRLRVKKIVPVPVMEGLSRVVGANTHYLAGIYVNPHDYNIGADKGGAVNMFDDFDIDYNKMKYLIETRCSGALTIPYSAAAIEFVMPTPADDGE